MDSRHQGLFKYKLSRCSELKCFDADKENSEANEKIREDLKEGHCFGLSVIDGAMDVMEDLEWWDAVRVFVTNWDDKKYDLITDPEKRKITDPETLKKLKKLFEAEMAEEVNFPGSKDPVGLTPEQLRKWRSKGMIFERATSYARFEQCTTSELGLSGYCQDSELKQLQFTDSKGKVRTIQSYSAIGGSFYCEKNQEKGSSYTPEEKLLFLLNKEKIQGNICILGNGKHAIRVGYKNNKWILHDPNFSHEKKEDLHIEFDDDEKGREAFAKNIFEILGYIFSIKIASFEPNKDLSFPSFASLIDNLCFYAGLGFQQAIRVCPQNFLKFINDLESKFPNIDVFCEHFAEELKKENDSTDKTNKKSSIVFEFLPDEYIKPLLLKLARTKKAKQDIAEAISKNVIKFALQLATKPENVYEVLLLAKDDENIAASLLSIMEYQFTSGNSHFMINLASVPQPYGDNLYDLLVLVSLQYPTIGARFINLICKLSNNNISQLYVLGKILEKNPELLVKLVRTKETKRDIAEIITKSLTIFVHRLLTEPENVYEVLLLAKDDENIAASLLSIMEYQFTSTRNYFIEVLQGIKQPFSKDLNILLALVAQQYPIIGAGFVSLICKQSADDPQRFIWEKILAQNPNLYNSFSILMAKHAPLEQHRKFYSNFASSNWMRTYARSYPQLVNFQLKKARHGAELLARLKREEKNQSNSAHLKNSKDDDLQLLSLPLEDCFDKAKRKEYKKGEAGKIQYAPFHPVVYNIKYFDRYAKEALFGERKHNTKLVAHVLTFLRDFSVEFNTSTEEQSFLPTLELLKQLYVLKSNLLIETHKTQGKGYFHMVFDCAMTSELAKHVDIEISSIEKLVKKHSTNVQSCHPEDIAKKLDEIKAAKEAIIGLQIHYGSSFRRLSTAISCLFGASAIDSEKLEKPIQYQEASLNRLGIIK